MVNNQQGIIKDKSDLWASFGIGHIPLQRQGAWMQNIRSKESFRVSLRRRKHSRSVQGTSICTRMSDLQNVSRSRLLLNWRESCRQAGQPWLRAGKGSIREVCLLSTPLSHLSATSLALADGPILLICVLYCIAAEPCMLSDAAWPCCVVILQSNSAPQCQAVVGNS